MLDKKDIEEIIKLVTDIVIGVLKWIYLAMTVIFGGLTIGYLVIILVRNTSLPETFIAELTSYITYYSESEAYALLNEVGLLRLASAAITYSFANTITYGLIYYMIANYRLLLTSLEKGEKPTKKRLKNVKECLIVSVLSVIINPLCITLAFILTGVLDMNHFNLTGTIFLVLAYAIYLLYDYSYRLVSSKDSLARELDEAKEQIADSKVKEIKTTKKEPVKKTTAKKATKKTTKK